jgi:hypothetical protein
MCRPVSGCLVAAASPMPWARTSGLTCPRWIYVAPIYATRSWATSTCALPGCNVLISLVLTCRGRISIKATWKARLFGADLEGANLDRTYLHGRGS